MDDEFDTIFERLNQIALQEFATRGELIDYVQKLRAVLYNVQHGVSCPSQSGWLRAGPCTCGLDAALKGKSP